MNGINGFNGSKPGSVVVHIVDIQRIAFVKFFKPDYANKKYTRMHSVARAEELLRYFV